MKEDKKQKNCPLTLTEWIDFLRSMQNTYSMIYYSQSQYHFALLITIVSFINIGLIVFTIINSIYLTDLIGSIGKIIVGIIMIPVLIAFAIYIIKFLNSFLKLEKNRRKFYIPWSRDIENLIDYILHGKFNDSNEILKAFDRIIEKHSTDIENDQIGNL